MRLPLQRRHAVLASFALARVGEIPAEAGGPKWWAAARSGEARPERTTEPLKSLVRVRTLIALFQSKLKPLFSPRFIKFGVVGATGVLINLGFLFFFADVLDLHTNLASGLAIELSILNNFLLNDRWTFADRRHADVPFARRAIDFHAVSLIGALVQLVIFVSGNVIWMYFTSSSDRIDAYFATAGNWIERYVVHPLFAPPEVGALKYLSQLAGIGTAVLWNFLANFHWTWRTEVRTK